jgi:hypothetical protein
MAIRSLLAASFCFHTILLLPNITNAQVITGTIINGTTQQAVPFVNVGLPHRNLGTVSDEQGHYNLPYNAAYAADTVRISSVGFQPRLVPFSSLLSAPSVTLTPQNVALSEVSVAAVSVYQRTHTVGLATPAPKTNFHMMANELGTEIGSLIHLPQHPALVQSLHVAVVQNEAGPLTFRLNLYRLDAQGRPTTEKLLHRDVLLTAQSEAGVLTVDLTADHLVLDEDFLLGLEWVKGPAASSVDLTKQIRFGGALHYGGQLYVRLASQADWIKPTVKSNVPLLGKRPTVALYATVKD